MLFALASISPVFSVFRSGVLSPGQAQEYVDKIKADMQLEKEKYDQERARQEGELHAKLSKLKQQRMNEKKKQLERELGEFEKSKKETQSEGTGMYT